MIIFLSMIIWYAVGIISMGLMKIHLMPVIENREIFVLGLAGPIVTLYAIYCWFAPSDD